ncbi:hypothetical protein JIN84_08005 [Luteolibacter yonseiensis]|uniref:Uncharacterized protein n=1 Tax=Luteolibacter yonseiensis TaxID=1144680 RepID=A0A934R5I8_9BACT|nr:hypothetical protein [Luteolibacter yonseiensis]MBK1815554.1 hypothetical protein [Luteolibacter yonseiensis]
MEKDTGRAAGNRLNVRPGQAQSKAVPGMAGGSAGGPDFFQIEYVNRPVEGAGDDWCLIRGGIQGGRIPSRRQVGIQEIPCEIRRKIVIFPKPFGFCGVDVANTDIFYRGLGFFSE